MEGKNDYAVLVLNVTRIPFPDEEESCAAEMRGEFERILHKKAENGSFIIDNHHEKNGYIRMREQLLPCKQDYPTNKFCKSNCLINFVV